MPRKTKPPQFTLDKGDKLIQRTMAVDEELHDRMKALADAKGIALYDVYAVATRQYLAKNGHFVPEIGTMKPMELLFVVSVLDAYRNRDKQRVLGTLLDTFEILLRSWLKDKLYVREKGGTLEPTTFSIKGEVGQRMLATYDTLHTRMKDLVKPKNMALFELYAEASKRYLAKRTFSIPDVGDVTPEEKAFLEDALYAYRNVKNDQQSALIVEGLETFLKAIAGADL